MSYLDKQIKTILEFDGTAVAVGVGVGGTLATLFYQLIKYANKISCQEPRWSNYVDQMNTAIKQAKRENNTKIVDILQDQLENDKERCKKINGDN